MKVSTIGGKPLLTGGKVVVTPGNPCACGDCGGGGGGTTGACCSETSCTITTEAGCDGDYQGNDTTCSPNPCDGSCDHGGGPCGSGACCIDGECSILSESDCTDGGGNYLGDDSTCDDVDCTQGACCFDTFCEIDTPSDCSDFGGVYQGDGSTCATNPCHSCDCGFEDFLGSQPNTRYLVKTYVFSRTSHGGGSPSCDGSQNDTTIKTVTLHPDGSCVMTTACSGSDMITIDGVGCTADWVNSGVSEGTDCGFTCGCHESRFDCGACYPGNCDVCTPTPTSATVAQCTCHASGVPSSTADTTLTATLSSPFTCGLGASPFADPFFQNN